MISPFEAQALYDRCIAQHHVMDIDTVSFDPYADHITPQRCMTCHRTYFFDNFGEILMITTEQGKTEKSRKT